MDPLSAILATLYAAFSSIVLYFWPKLMGWAQEHLLPWADRYLPLVAEEVRLAFAEIDKVAVELRSAVKGAWRKLRTVLLSETAQFVRLLNDQWAVRITSYLRNLEEGAKPFVRTVTEQHVDWDDLPAEIRSQALANGISDQTIDIRTVRDRLLDEMHQ